MALGKGSGGILKAGGGILSTIGVVPALPAIPAGFTDPDNWTNYAGNPIISAGANGQWDDNWVHPHSVMQVGAEYWMWYGGSGGSGSADTPGRVGLATSPDGYTWTRYGSNPIFVPAVGQWDSYKVEHLHVRYENGAYKGWYAGEATDHAMDIGYVTSADGISWSRYAGNPVMMRGSAGQWDSYWVFPCNVWKENEIYQMHYWGGSDYGTASWAVGLATSPDGITWTKYAGNPIFPGASGQWDTGILDTHCLISGNTYYLFYQGNPADGQTSSIGVATSLDGLSWTRSPNNPFPRVAAWENAWNEGPVLIKIGETWMMYYMGYNLSAFGIGVMTFTPPA